jgi:hypothetical protein
MRDLSIAAVREAMRTDNLCAQEDVAHEFPGLGASLWR